MKRLRPILLLLLAACGNGASSPEGTPAASTPAATPDKAEAQKVVLELRRWKEPQEVVRVGLGGITLGPAGEPGVLSLFPRRESQDDLRSFARTYAPFSTRTAEGELVFRGRGAVKAGPLERRMIAEWSRRVAAEAATGRDAAAYGLVLAWRRGGPAGSCDEVAVFLSGEARGSSCSWGAEIRGRLDPAHLGRLYGWFDRLASFQTGSEDVVPIGSTQSRLIFAGKGKRRPTPDEEADLTAFALDLHRELAARWTGPAAVPAGEATPAPPPRLLLPPETTGRTGGARPAQLEIPAEPPPKKEEAKPVVRRRPSPQGPHPPAPSPVPGEGEEDQQPPP